MHKSCAGTVEPAYFPLFFKVAEETYVLKVDFNYTSLPEETEPAPNEEDPGGFLRLNDNDDDGEAGVDKDRVTTAPELAAADPELRAIAMAMAPVPDTGTVTLTIPAGIRVWESAKKKSLITGPWDLATAAQKSAFNALLTNGAWIEGIGTGTGDIALSYGSVCSDKVKMTVIQVKFKEDVQYSGYDDSVDPNWIMSPKTGSNTALAEITPSTAANRVNFESVDIGRATVSPANASSSPQRITVSGKARGETEVHAKLGSLGTASSILRVTTKVQVNRTVAIHAITEDNDDVQAILVGMGQAGQACIAAGTNGVLDTSASGDDAVSGMTITSGPDGICNSTASADDVQAIAINQGKSNVVCVTRGANNFRDTGPSGDDVVNGDSIDTGANGICDTAASSVDIVPNNVPSAASLQTYLNDVFGKQADVVFIVTRSDYELNYDLDRNGGVPDPPNESEMDEIAAIAASAGVDGNIYFVRVMDAPIATTRSWRHDAFIQSATGGTAENVAAHELGHVLGLHHNDSEAINLMHSSTENGRQLQKFEWDTVNP